MIKNFEKFKQFKFWKQDLLQEYQIETFTNRPYQPINNNVDCGIYYMCNNLFNFNFFCHSHQRVNKNFLNQQREEIKKKLENSNAQQQKTSEILQPLKESEWEVHKTLIQTKISYMATQLKTFKKSIIQLMQFQKIDEKKC